MTQQEIKQGQIWEITTDMFFTGGKDATTYYRQLNIKKGERIEIRYPYAWHFRTEDHHYFQAEPEMILENAKLIGVIWDKVKWQNNANLKQIIELSLFDKIEPNDQQ